MLKKKLRLAYITLLFVSLFIFVAFNTYSNSQLVVDLARNSCPKGPIMTVIQGGNTANNVWEYLSVFAISKMYPERHYQPYVPDGVITKVEEIFDSVSIPALSTIPKKCHLMKHPLVVRMEDPPSVIANMKNHNTSVTLGMYSARYDEIIEYGLDKVKEELRFRKQDVEKANRMLDSIKGRFYFAERNVEPIFVCVHYRGGDYVPLLFKYYKQIHGISTFRYYNKAMDYFKKRYKNVIFIVISTDSDWLEENVKNFMEHPIVNPYKNASKLDDMALLGHCNHSIINYGTFGVTGAMMAGGTTIVYDLGVPLDHNGMTVAMGMADILPNWIKMDEKKEEEVSEKNNVEY